MKGEYLFYEEKIETTEEEKQAKAARRFVFHIAYSITSKIVYFIEQVAMQEAPYNMFQFAVKTARQSPTA